jgi:hypothetical protein
VERLISIVSRFPEVGAHIQLDGLFCAFTFISYAHTQQLHEQEKFRKERKNWGVGGGTQIEAGCGMVHTQNHLHTYVGGKYFILICRYVYVSL